MKTLHMILLSGLLTTAVQPKVKADYNNNEIIATIGIGAAAIAGLVGLGFFVDWLLTPTDEQLIANIQSDILDYKNNAHVLIADLSSHSYGDYASVAYSLQRIVDAAGGADISRIKSRIDNTAYNFDNAQRELSKRIAKLSKNYAHNAQVIRQMDALKTELHMIQPSLLYAQRFIKDHSAYFELGLVLDKVYKKFTYEYTIAYNNSPISMELIKISPLLARNYKYIWHEYIDDMKSVLSQIQNAAFHINPQWIPAYGKLYPIYERLNIYFPALIAQVQTSDLFNQEKLFKAQQEFLERQLALEREMKRIEQAKLDAMREHNKLKEQELQLKYEQLLAQYNTNNRDTNITIEFRN